MSLDGSTGTLCRRIRDMANKSEESVSPEGMLLGGGSRGKWGTAAIWDVRRPANDAIVVSDMQKAA